jgi:hypothetical protein
VSRSCSSGEARLHVALPEVQRWACPYEPKRCELERARQLRSHARTLRAAEELPDSVAQSSQRGGGESLGPQRVRGQLPLVPTPQQRQERAAAVSR